MNDERLLLEMRRWLQDEHVALPDAEEAGQRIAAHLPTTRQRRRRWWRLPRLARTPKPPATHDTTELQPSRIPATNGHTPTVIGRTQSMFSPAKAIIAGAIVFAIGGAFLIAQPFDQEAIVPAASVDAEPTWVTGTVELSEDCIKSPTATDDGVVRERFDCPGQTWTADDPRLTGEVRKMWRLDGYRTEAGYRSLLSNRHIVDTEDGTWECESLQVAGGTGLTAGILQQETITCVGDGAHAGLTAIVQVDWGEVGHPFEALVFSGQVSPAPDASDFE